MDGLPTRRHLLRLAGIASVLGLAGCTGSTDDTEQETTSTEAGGTEADPGTTGGMDTETDDTEPDASETTRAASEPREVEFATRAGTAVRGTLLGDGSCGVVFAHGVGFDRADWRPQSERLAADGRVALGIDLNLDDRSTTPEYVLAAVRYLREQVGVDDVVLVGASAGANAVVRANAAATDETIDGTMGISAGRAAEAATEVQGRSLFVVSEGDSDRFVQTTEEMAENAPEPTALEVLPGEAHGQDVFETDQGDELVGLIREFVRTVCEE
ncbi:lipase family protein [Halorussus salinisoli]|uniref:alpha/beta hydrolase n=1 Tax=Halorussus salinisoli TaxID=2558242 RepID=UPI0010C16764|nr:alpha/beta hydrolase [Halorussus salinisoli]